MQYNQCLNCLQYYPTFLMQLQFLKLGKFLIFENLFLSSSDLHTLIVNGLTVLALQMLLNIWPTIQHFCLASWRNWDPVLEDLWKSKYKTLKSFQTYSAFTLFIEISKLKNPLIIMEYIWLKINHVFLETNPLEFVRLIGYEKTWISIS